MFLHSFSWRRPATPRAPASNAPRRGELLYGRAGEDEPVERSHPNGTVVSDVVSIEMARITARVAVGIEADPHGLHGHFGGLKEPTQARFVRLEPRHQVDDPHPQGAGAKTAIELLRHRSSSHASEGLLQVSKDVIDVLDADREPHKIRGDTGRHLLLSRELLVRGRGRMDRQALRVTDVRYV